MRLTSFLLAGGMLLASSAAFAQWIWLDKDGHKVFSDRAPPLDVPAKNVLKQPGAPMRAPAAAPAGNGPDGAPVDKPQAAAPSGPSALDKAVDERKKKAATDEAEKKKAEEARIAQEKASNCEQARQSKATLDSGMRIARVNADGERIIMDDAARQAETERIQGIIDSNCQ